MSQMLTNLTGLWKAFQQSFEKLSIPKTDSKVLPPATVQDVVERMIKIKVDNPNNLAAKHFNQDYFSSLEKSKQERLVQICQSGLQNPTSSIGAYANQPEDYELFAPFFDPLVMEYHNLKKEDLGHQSNWDVSSLKDESLPADLDLATLGLNDTSMRIRVARNLEKWPLPGSQTREERIGMENELVIAFETLIADEKFGGNYYSLTPGSKYEISPEKYDDLVKGHVMFKDMSKDSFLLSAGIAQDWPYGRGTYQSADKEFLVWVGEEDHLRIMCMKVGTGLGEVKDRLHNALAIMEAAAGKFAHIAKYGYVSSCPTNVGSGMRASLHLQVPWLTKDAGALEKVCKGLGLSVRGLGGEHTAYGEDGTVDISPRARLVTESFVVASLYRGTRTLLSMKEGTEE